MERLDKLINILKLTPHHQPELVKEASNRILSRPIRSDPQVGYFLKPLIEILIQYCDTDDSTQRSIFNDHLNSVILAFQYTEYRQIFQVLLDVITTNGSARTVTAALHRIPHIIQNVQPIDLGCEPQKLLKSLIEVARRSDDESVLKALDSLFKEVMPYLAYHVRKSKELLTNTLIEILFRNLQHESSQIKRLAASSIATISNSSDLLLQNTTSKLVFQLESLSATSLPNTATSLNLESNTNDVINRFVGFCLAMKELPQMAEKYHVSIIKMIIKQLEVNFSDIILVTAALETLKELFKYQLDRSILNQCSKLIVEKFLISEHDGKFFIKSDIKIILQSNALACISAIIKQRPTTLDQLEAIFLFKNHSDVAVRNQVITIIGHYIKASWQFPFCVDASVNCERMRRLWVELRSILYDDSVHPDTLKQCVISIRACVDTLLESDHCLHIVEYQDINQLIELYSKSNFKPFKIEVLGLVSTLNYRTLHYLERSHWVKMKSRIAGSFIESLQDKIVNKIIIASLVDEHQRVRAAATSALITIIPNLYIINLDNGQKNIFQRSIDPIVSLANDLASEHLVVLEQADEHMFHNYDTTMINLELHEKLSMRNDHTFLSSSIIQLYDNPHNEQSEKQIEITKSQHRINISINLMYMINLLKSSMENSLDKGKMAISSIVKSLYELSLVYPVYQYSISWDCRSSEYCECFTLLNFLLTYLENLNEPDVIVEELEAYKNFLALLHQLLFALCHESVLSEYEYQKMKPLHKRQASIRDGYWSELTLKHPGINSILEIYFIHLTKLLCIMSCLIEERNNPLNPANQKLTPSQEQKIQQQESLISHSSLATNKLLFNRIQRKLESSFKSSKKNLNQREEKFYQILDTCLLSMSSLLEFVSMSKSMEYVREILGYIKITSPTCSASSVICARQLLKSLFGINIIALYQLDPHDWFEEESWPLTPTNLMSQSQESSCAALQGIYHHLIAHPYKIFSNYYSINCSLTPTSDKALAILNFESRRALKVRRRIEERVKALFEYNPHQLISPKVRQLSELLKNTIIEFTPVVTFCMNQFNNRGFCRFQNETLQFMSYLILLRVNYQKLALASDLITSINRLLDQCADKAFAHRVVGIENFLRNSFTFMTLLSYERGPSKPMFKIATVIQKLDDVRAKLSMISNSTQDIITYIVPPLRCLVEDLFIYRTSHFQNSLSKPEFESSLSDIKSEAPSYEMVDQSKKDMFETLEAERETVAQKLLDVVENPRVYDLLSILILESRQNSSEIKYKKLSQHLLAIIPTMLSKRQVNLTDYRCIELTRRIIENISPEVFQPVNFIFETLLEAPKPAGGANYRQEFQRWMSLVIISMHILINQVKEEVFLTRLRENMSDEAFVEDLLNIAQLCMAEILLNLNSPTNQLDHEDGNIVFLTQQLSSFMLYLTHMFQSGAFFQLSRSASELIRRKTQDGTKGPRSFRKLCVTARDPFTGFSLYACEKMFYYTRLLYPDLTILWCNVMMLLNYVDCNREFWRDSLVYECHHCQAFENLNKSLQNLSVGSSTDRESNVDSIVEDTCTGGTKNDSRFTRSTHINRPSSLNLSDITFNDQLRRSFIKKIAAAESRDKALNRNIVETSDEDGQLLEREVSIGNTEQCLSPNMELARRGTLCLVLDFVTISMNDVEHITWLIIHHINDIIRWSHETPITEFINAVHGNSASSGIFIQAINSGFNNLSSISFVARLLWTLQNVHYTQYGSLVVLLIEKLLSSSELLPYRSLTRSIEEFSCATVQKLLDETNKSLVTTNDEVVNQLTGEDLDRISSMLDSYLYPKLSKLILELREATNELPDAPAIELHTACNNYSDTDSESDELDILDSKILLIQLLAEKNLTAQISSLLPALNRVQTFLADPKIFARVNEDQLLVARLISAIYSLALTILPPPPRLIAPKFWTECNEELTSITPNGDRSIASSIVKPVLFVDSKRSLAAASLLMDNKSLLADCKGGDSNKNSLVELCRLACLKGSFLIDNISYLEATQYEYLPDIIIRMSRLNMINSFILTPPILWRNNVWPIKFNESDMYKIYFPMVTHDILSKDYKLLENFCDRLLKLGWTSRRQFEEAWMTLLGVLSASLTPTDKSMNISMINFEDQENEKKLNLVITSITKLLLLTRKTVKGDPLSSNSFLVQTFDDRVIELIRNIGSNLSSLRKKTRALFESLELERTSSSKQTSNLSLANLSINNENQLAGFSSFLTISAQKLRMNVIMNVELDLQDTVVIEDENDKLKNEEVDVESCIRLLLSIYKQKIKDPNENLYAISASPTHSNVSTPQQTPTRPAPKNRPDQLAPPLTTAIAQSIIALSDMFTEYEQFEWLFETLVQMFKLAERNEDEIQMQYLIIGLCKATAICCYEMPNELNLANTTTSTSSASINSREVMFEKCRQSLEKCIKSDSGSLQGPLKLSSLFGAYYMLEDSVNIVASGAWELDHFKQLRQSRLAWILRLMPIILNPDNSKLLTKKAQVIKLLDSLYEILKESETRTIKA